MTTKVIINYYSGIEEIHQLIQEQIVIKTASNQKTPRPSAGALLRALFRGLLRDGRSHQSINWSLRSVISKCLPVQKMESPFENSFSPVGGGV